VGDMSPLSDFAEPSNAKGHGLIPATTEGGARGSGDWLARGSANVSETTPIRIYQDGGLLDVVAIVLWIMAAIVVVVGVVGLVISGVTPVSISGCLFLGAVAAMAAGGAALARSGGRAGSVLGFSEASLVARGGFPGKEVSWRSIRGVDLSRHEFTEPFPRILSVRPVNGLASDVVVIQPSRVVPPDALQSAAGAPGRGV